jgi:hypothetical protein
VRGTIVSLGTLREVFALSVVLTLTLRQVYIPHETYYEDVDLR